MMDASEKAVKSPCILCRVWSHYNDTNRDLFSCFHAPNLEADPRFRALPDLEADPRSRAPRASGFVAVNFFLSAYVPQSGANFVREH